MLHWIGAEMFESRERDGGAEEGLLSVRKEEERFLQWTRWVPQVFDMISRLGNNLGKVPTCR